MDKNDKGPDENAMAGVAALVLDHCGGGIIALDDKWCVTLVNARAVDIIGREDLLGRCIWDEYPQLAENSLFWIEGHEAVRTGAVRHYEEYYDWRSVWIQTKAVPDGKGGVVFFFRDITREREARAQQLLDAGLFGILHWSLSGASTDANDRFLEIVGYTRDDLHKGLVDWAELTPPELRARDAEAVEEIQQTGRHLPYEKSFCRKDGSLVPVMVGGALYHGSQTEGVSFVLDLSEQKHAEEEQKRLREELLEEVLRRRRFVREMLFSLTEGRLRLCDSADELPDPLPPATRERLLTRPALRQFRDDLQETGKKAGLTEDRVHDLITGAAEAAMNAVVHAGSGVGRVCLDAGTGTVQVWVTDTGTGITEDSIHRATLERGWTTTGTLGHGFWLMLRTCDRIYLLTGASGTTVVLEQQRSAPVPAWLQAVPAV